MARPRKKQKQLQNRWQQLLPLAVVVLVGCVLALPLFGNRFIPTHDGEYHIIRFMEFFRMLSAGYLFPRWAPTLNSGYGLPLFNFQYPFPNYIGSLLLALGFSAPAAFRLTLAAGYLLATAFSYVWLKKLFSAQAALLGALAGSLVPYWFVDIYVRGSVGEVWAFTWLFAVLASVEYRRRIPAAVFLALLIISHNIMAMLFVPVLLVYILFRGDRRPWWILTGVALSAYFWLPALLEKKYVTGLSPVNFRDHFAQLYELLIPSWGTGFSAATDLGNKISFQIGMMPLAVSALTAVSFLRYHKTEHRSLVMMALTGWLFSVVLMLPVSVPVWSLVTPMQLIQFPWRLLSFGIPVTALSAAYLTETVRFRWLPWGLIFFGLLLVYPYARPVTYEPRGTAYYQNRRNFTDGTNSLGNIFSTVWTPWIKDRAPALFSVSGGGDVRVLKNTYLDKTVEIRTQSAKQVTAAVLYFPGWTVLVNGSPVPIDFRTGTVRFTVPSGTSAVEVKFRGTTIEHAGETVSLMALVILIIQAILPIYAYRHRHVTT